MSKKTRQKLIRTAGVLGLLAALGGYGAFSAFTATTSNANNTMSCAGFVASSTAYDGTLAAFPTSFAASTVDGKAAAAAWNTSDSVDYRFTIYTLDDTSANAHTTTLSTGNHTIFWEAQNN